MGLSYRRRLCNTDGNNLCGIGKPLPVNGKEECLHGNHKQYHNRTVSFCRTPPPHVAAVLSDEKYFFP